MKSTRFSWRSHRSWFRAIAPLFVALVGLSGIARADGATEWKVKRSATFPRNASSYVHLSELKSIDGTLWLFESHGDLIWNYDIATGNVRTYTSSDCSGYVLQIVPLSQSSALVLHDGIGRHGGAACVSALRSGVSSFWSMTGDAFTATDGVRINDTTLLIDTTHARLMRLQLRNPRLRRTLKFAGWAPQQVRACNGNSAWVSLTEDNDSDFQLFVHFDSNGRTVKRTLPISGNFVCGDNDVIIAQLGNGELVKILPDRRLSVRKFNASTAAVSDCVRSDMVLKAGTTGYATLRHGPLPVVVRNNIYSNVINVGSGTFFMVFANPTRIALEQLDAPKRSPASPKPPFPSC